MVSGTYTPIAMVLVLLFWPVAMGSTAALEDQRKQAQSIEKKGSLITQDRVGTHYFFSLSRITVFALNIDLMQFAYWLCSGESEIPSSLF